MSLFEEDFDIDYDIENYDGVKFGDIFYLNYYGINVFFYVCGLDHHRVRIFELAKKRKMINGEHAEYLTPKLRPTTSPCFVLRNNCWTKSEYWVETTAKEQIVIPISDASRILDKARKLGVEFPQIGLALVDKLNKEQRANVLNYYWEAPKKIKQQKINKNKISA